MPRRPDPPWRPARRTAGGSCHRHRFWCGSVESRHRHPLTPACRLGAPGPTWLRLGEEHLHMHLGGRRSERVGVDRAGRHEPRCARDEHVVTAEVSVEGRRQAVDAAVRGRISAPRVRVRMKRNRGCCACQPAKRSRSITSGSVRAERSRSAMGVRRPKWPPRTAPGSVPAQSRPLGTGPAPSRLGHPRTCRTT